MVSILGMTSLQRKRLMGSAGELPEWVRVHYPPGQAATLVVIARVARRKGRCDLHIDRIGKLAGAGRSTVRLAIKNAQANGHLIVTSRTAEGETNLITLAFP